jgi:mannosyltransferase OCH1-like enzyme
MAIPKIIWFLWYRGFERIPPIVQKCYESWKLYNPDWRVIFLDENNLGKYFTLSVSEAKFRLLSNNHRSDIIRTELLVKYGGVRDDATTLCRQPLGSWLGEHDRAGFFTFVHETRGYGWIYNRFIATEAGNPLAVAMNREFTAFFGTMILFTGARSRPEESLFWRNF